MTFRHPCAALCGALAWLAAASAFADDAPAVASPPLAQPARSALSATELDGTRGGFATPLGYDIGFGAEVRTYVDGKLVLQTRLTWTSEGVARAVEAGEITPDLVAQAAGKGLHLLPAQAVGVLVEGDGGATAVLHDLDASHIASLVVNNASNRDIRQDTAISLDIPDFASMQAGVRAAQTQLRLQTAMSLALRDAGR
jgi:hypothetical protein